MSEATLKKIAKYSLYLVPLVALVYFNGFYYPYVVTKTLYFRLLVGAGLVAYLVLLARHYGRYKPKMDWALGIVGVYAAILIAAAFVGLDWHRSFFSIFERMEGVLLWVFMFGYLFLLKQFLAGREDWMAMIRIIVGVSGLVSAYAIIQYFALLPVFGAGIINRAASTIGNAAFLAGFLILAIALGAYWFQREERKNWRIAVAGIAALNIGVLFLTATRGAILGFLIGLVVYAALWALLAPGRRAKHRAASVAVLVALVATSALFYANRSAFQDSNIEFVRRIARISAEDSNITNRLQVWQIGWQSFLENPVLGVGPENFYTVYNKHFTPKLSEDWFDRTHNIYLDQLVHAGILGFVAYAAIWIYVFAMLLGRRKEDFPLFASIGAGLVAYGIHNAFVFDTISSLFVFVFIIGLVAYMGQSSEQDSPSRALSPAAAKAMLAATAVIGLLALYYLIAIPYAANRNIYIGYRFAIASPERSYESFAENSDRRFGIGETGHQINSAAEVLTTQGSADAGTINRYLAAMKNVLNAAAAHNPYDVRNRLYLGQFLIDNPTSNSDFDRAEEVLVEAVQLSPSRPQPNYLLFNLYLQRGQTDNAIAILEQLRSRLPWSGEPLIHLANTIKVDDPELAEQYFEEGIAKEYRSGRGPLLAIVEYLLHTEQYERVVPYYHELIAATQEPDRYDYVLDLAKIYYLTDQFEESRGQIEVLQQRYPQLLETAESQELIRMINTAL